MPNDRAAIDARDQRTNVRFATALRVQFAGGEGCAHNVSTHGVYFVTDVPPRLGSLVELTVEFTLDGRRRSLLCEGKVVRVEPQGGRHGIAARLLAPFFDGQGR